LGVALGHRAYVVGIDPDTATVRLGDRQALLARGALLDELSLAPGEDLPLRAGVCVRYRAAPVPAEIRPSADGGAEIAFDTPTAPVVAGQFAVFYRGDQVLGGGRIRATMAWEAS
jgi:tRNA-specific 2-thiouridylase